MSQDRMTDDKTCTQYGSDAVALGFTCDEHMNKEWCGDLKKWFWCGDKHTSMRPVARTVRYKRAMPHTMHMQTYNTQYMT